MTLYSSLFSSFPSLFSVLHCDVCDAFWQARRKHDFIGPAVCACAAIRIPLGAMHWSHTHITVRTWLLPQPTHIIAESISARNSSQCAVSWFRNVISFPRVTFKNVTCQGNTTPSVYGASNSCACAILISQKLVRRPCFTAGSYSPSFWEIETVCMYVKLLVFTSWSNTIHVLFLFMSLSFLHLLLVCV